MGNLPTNGDATIHSCLNCDSRFESAQELGSWITCDYDEGGCGFTFKLIAKTGKLEKSD